MSKPYKWKMPKELEQYRDLLSTCGHNAEDLMNGHSSVQINAALALIETGVEAQLALLMRLDAKGLLR